MATSSARQSGLNSVDFRGPSPTGEVISLRAHLKGVVPLPLTLDEFERSGISGIKFAELTGLKYQTLATWLQQRKRRRTATTQRKTPAKVRWLEAVVGKTADHGAGSSLLVQLPGGAHLEITTARQVPLAAALLRALEKAGAC